MVLKQDSRLCFNRNNGTKFWIFQCCRSQYKFLECLHPWRGEGRGVARCTAFAAAWEALAPQLFLLQMSGWWEEELRSHLKGAFLLFFFFFFLKKKVFSSFDRVILKTRNGSPNKILVNSNYESFTFPYTLGNLRKSCGINKMVLETN